jgi:hypothetical protein
MKHILNFFIFFLAFAGFTCWILLSVEGADNTWSALFAVFCSMCITAEFMYYWMEVIKHGKTL